MYFFVRFTGIVAIILGAFLMLFGVGTAIYVFLQNAEVLDLINNHWWASSGIQARLLDARFYGAVFGLFSFLTGMVTSALGQLLLVFADVANNTRETNAILRGMRKSED